MNTFTRRSREKNTQMFVRRGASQQPEEMTSASGPPTDSLMEKHLTCSICMDIFTRPVTTPCGHSFCKPCLDVSMYMNTMCPLCKKHLSKPPEVNIVLRDIAQQMETTKRQKYFGAAGEVACDVCIEPKLKAKKSCLMCLTSYCQTHLDNHRSSNRLKGHKLVEPVKNLDERACLKHGRPLELYSKKQQKCICVGCLEEGQDEVTSSEEEWNRKKAQLGNIKTELEEKIRTRRNKMEEVANALKNCQNQIEREWWDVDAVFSAVMAILEAARDELQNPLDERKKLLEKEAKDLKDELESEIIKFRTTISKLDDVSGLEDHILFLQTYPVLSLEHNMTDWTAVELNTSLSFGTMRGTTMRMIETIQQQLEKLTAIELTRLPKFTADVELDPNTAHRRLVLSDDGKEVKDGGEDQDVADTPERFDLFGSVLGLNSLTSERSYWEVEVWNKTGWDLGVASGGANRKGKLKLSPDNGYWVLVHYEEENYAAMSSPPVGLSLSEKPKKVGVFVDSVENIVSFYDVAAQSHIYTFKDCLFYENLYPYFSPHIKQDEKNVESLVISIENEEDKVWTELRSISV